ncbi:MAG: hypothetical protein ACM3H8_11580 [Sphingobacteriales bacterium]
MGKMNLPMLAYVLCIVIGGYMILFTADGKIIRVCIACGSMITNILAVISILVGAIGIIKVAGAKTIAQK